MKSLAPRFAPERLKERGACGLELQEELLDRFALATVSEAESNSSRSRKTRVDHGLLDASLVQSRATCA